MAFKFDYNQTIQQAKQLDEVASQMQNGVIKKLEEVCDNIEAAWTGDAGKAYLKYMQQLRSDLQKKAKYLRDTADFLRSTAKKMRAAEAEAKAAAQKI